jgi:hypothetical protein
MKPSLVSGRNVMMLGLLGAAILMAAPATSSAQQEKWWTPREGGRERVQRNVTRREQARVPQWDRGLRRGENRAWRDYSRYGRVYRDNVMIRDGRRGPQYRAYRYWFRPQFHRQYVVVRPVRYWVAAGARIGGVLISARIFPHGRYWYGCNFCDLRFDDYGHWSAHVRGCDHRPHGYRVQTAQWEDDWDRFHEDDRGWTRGDDDDYYYDE